MRSSIIAWGTAAVTAVSVNAGIEYPAIEFTAAASTFWDWSVDSCEREHIPDGPVRVYRDAANRLQMYIYHYMAYRLIGNDFNSLQKDCSNGPVFTSDRSPDPGLFNDHEWMAPCYTQDGITVYSAVHNEYHGWDHPGQCDSSTAVKSCWYNGVTWAVSTDTGRSFLHAPAPNHVLACPPYKYIPNQGPYGVFGGSNIIKHPTDGYYYLFLTYMDLRQRDRRGMFLMRTNNVADPASWRGYKNGSFTVQFKNPYTTAITDTESCIPDVIDGAGGTVKWSTTFNCWIGIGTYSAGIGRKGFSFSLSDDLITWSKPVVFFNCNIMEDPDPNLLADIFAYPTIIDHNDTTRNFWVLGDSCYLYFTRWYKSNGDYDRNVLRRPVRLFKRGVSGFVVTSAGGGEDKNPGDGICANSSNQCTMVAAVMESNRRPVKFADTVLPITFNISTSGGAAATISPSEAIPAVTMPVAINGFSQPGAQANTAGSGEPMNAVYKVILNATSGGAGISLQTTGASVMGLVINNFTQFGIRCLDGGNNTIAGNYIGTNAAGSSAQLGMANAAVQIEGSQGNRIGTAADSGRNLIVGGVRIVNGSARESRGNVLLNNRINIDAAGTTNLAGDFEGVIVSAPGNRIGSAIAGGRNVIASGVRLMGSAANTDTVSGNYIGTDITGARSIASRNAGVTLQDSANGNVIGGAAAGNVLAGNNIAGVSISGRGTVNNLIAGNKIGLRAAGDSVLANSGPGVFIKDTANGNMIGVAGAGNIIAGSSDAGIWIDDAAGNSIMDNYVGTDSSGRRNLGNDCPAILLYKRSGNTLIGGRSAGAGNVIKFNRSGICVRDNAGSGVTIAGNSITANEGMGIDLGWNNMADENDSLDGDVFQNYPIISSTVKTGAFIRVNGVLSSRPSRKYLIDFYADSICDASGYGEGRIYLGNDSVITSSDGIVSFSSTLPGNAAADTNWFVTVTATSPEGSTSEFCACGVLRPPEALLLVSRDSIGSTLDTMEDQTFQIILDNIGTAAMNWNAGKSTGWVSAPVPASGTIPPGAKDTLSITLDASGLSNGSYSDSLIISAQGLTKKIPVRLTVTRRPRLSAIPDTLRLTVTQGINANSQFKLKNKGSAGLRWNLGISFESPWVVINNSYRTGTLPPFDSAAIPVSISGQGRALGLDTGFIIVQGSNLQGEPVWNVSFDAVVIINVVPPTGAYGSRVLPAEFGVVPFDKGGKWFFRFAVPQECRATLRIFDMRGKQVVEVENKRFEPGWHVLTGGTGRLTPGVYFYRVLAQTGKKGYALSGSAIFPK